MRFNRFLLSLILMLPAINNIAQVLVNVKVDSLQLFIGEQTDITLGEKLTEQFSQAMLNEMFSGFEDEVGGLIGKDE